MAGRIPQHFIDTVLNRVDIVELIGSRIDLRKKGQNHLALCPFHDEKTPSFNVNEVKQFYYCFGCGAGGSALQFLMQYEHLSFYEAVEILARSAGLDMPEASSTDSIKRVDDNVYDLLTKTSALYSHYLLHQSDGGKALDYLSNRGLSESIINRYQLGYAPDRWDLLNHHFPSKNDLLAQAGLLSKNDNGREYDRFRHRVMFPICDSRGRIVGFGGRVLDDSKPKYLNSPETDVFQKSQLLYGLYEAKKYLKRVARIVVVEGYMDVISLAEQGIGYAVATMGTAIGSSHIKLMTRQTSDIIFCFDGDRAGRSAAWKAMEVLLPIIEDKWAIKFLFLPEEDDPDTFVQREGKEAFEQALNQAHTFSDFFIAHLSKQIDIKSIEGKARLGVLARPYLKKMSECLLKELLAKEIAKQATISVDQLLGHTHQDQPQQFLVREKNAPKSIKLGRMANNGLLRQKRSAKPATYNEPIGNIIALLILCPELARAYDSTALEGIEHDNLALLLAIWQLLRDNSNISIGEILGRWYGTHYMSVLEASLSKIMQYLDTRESKQPKKDFAENLAQLKIQDLDTKIKHLNEKDQQKTLSMQEWQQLNQLLKESNKLKSRYNDE